MTLFQNKYRVEPARLREWDYRRTGAYFITICTKNRQNIFGTIHNDVVELNEIGLVVKKEWLKTFERRKYLEKDEFIIMPNHFHGIVHLFNDKLEKEYFENEFKKENTIDKSNVFLKSRSIGSIILQFKSKSTKLIREKFSKDFGWQSRYYDHIIRTEKGLNNIREYIHNNPLKWTLDEYYEV